MQPPAVQQQPHAYRDLRSSIARINEHQSLAEVTHTVPAYAAPGSRGWQHCADMLADPDGLTAWRHLASRWLLDGFGEAPGPTLRAYVSSWYLHVPAYLAALLFHHERRVPSLRPEDLSFRIAAEGKPNADAIALHAETFACLSDDPAAKGAHTVVVESEGELAEILRTRYAAHASEFVRAYQPIVRSGRRPLWAAATDALDIGMWRAGKQAGDEESGVADAAVLLGQRHAPFTSASTLRAITTEKDEATWTRRKESCCFTYLLTEGKGECKTCPRVVPPA